MLKSAIWFLLFAGIYGPASGAILLEALLHGEAVRFEIGVDRDRVLFQSDNHRYLVDLTRRTVHEINPAGVQAVELPPIDGFATPHPFRIKQWGPGPPIAGYRSTFHVVQLDERICAEVLVSGWMRPFLEPILDSLVLLQRLVPALQPAEQDSACGAIPFEVYARNGWPLMAGRQDEIIFLTQSVSFEHTADTELFRLPGDPPVAAQELPK